RPPPRRSMRALDVDRHCRAHSTPSFRPQSPRQPPPFFPPLWPSPPPGSESPGLRLVAVVALVLANAFFVAAEFALVAARRTRIEAMVRRGDRKARTGHAAPHELYRPLSGAAVGITVASILLGCMSEDTVAHLFPDWF